MGRGVVAQPEWPPRTERGVAGTEQADVHANATLSREGSPATESVAGSFRRPSLRCVCLNTAEHYADEGSYENIVAGNGYFLAAYLATDVVDVGILESLFVFYPASPIVIMRIEACNHPVFQTQWFTMLHTAIGDFCARVSGVSTSPWSCQSAGGRQPRRRMLPFPAIPHLIGGWTVFTLHDDAWARF